MPGKNLLDRLKREGTIYKRNPDRTPQPYDPRTNAPNKEVRRK